MHWGGNDAVPTSASRCGFRCGHVPAWLRTFTDALELMPRVNQDALREVVTAAIPSAVTSEATCMTLIATAVSNIDTDIRGAFGVSIIDARTWRRAREAISTALAWTCNRESAWNLVRARERYLLALYKRNA